MRYKIRRFIGPATLNGNEVKKKKKIECIIYVVRVNEGERILRNQWGNQRLSPLSMAALKLLVGPLKKFHYMFKKTYYM